ncbi:hypothetical protein CcaverHIS002_0109100 [Cutaneotrichosporon cavernicola]|uniref:PCI domain-containing protein n=1 Tax=Cutaneotrichosporon cavernicola TaxID=279322 RepID=A0AA48I254_9TREE|nr:uncharacterized protein CcaverHIS019_0109020 [Cutaneotrichosporon cavernicola]BEI80381.1 hypothetical protein CcaverHIS002_0109100 [Cutaneotrichosporon cavernicola]BEI88184.1 hypothetical protein CcaverHIS019_0109020 [Cutaneotrichosporon cavernicola]BEI95956.1 hypothetical protein CcaverHIS631_0109050 [Cutaneotrichosporon cavernicola]BEJ03730.1 hypothetical protein CcaverHIS641_0109050 [Cutaneotrichosporon cavernicola]
MDVESGKTPVQLPLSALDAIDPDTFNWNAYIGTYKGRALITRLSHIPKLVLSQAKASPNARKLARVAALRAIPLIKEQTWDHNLYLRLVSQIDQTLNPGKTRATDDAMDVDAAYSKKGSEAEGTPDSLWVQVARDKEEAENNRLNVELNGYIANLIKESIRLTYLAQAELALKTGSLVEALRAWQQVRENCSGAAHFVELGLAVLEGSLQFNDTSVVSGNAAKTSASLDRLHPVKDASDAPVSSTMTRAQVEMSRTQAARSAEVRRAVGVKLRVARGLLAIDSLEFSRAACELGEIGEEGGLGEWDGVVISTADLAFLTAILALASGSRDYIKEVLLDRPSFHAAIDDSQPWILDLVRAFVGANYGEALTILRKAEPYMLLNPFIAPHTPVLLQNIRQRAVVQYVTPFSSVRISQMAEAFETDEDSMVYEVCQLAEDGAISARVDLVDRVFNIKEADPRAEAFRSALEGGYKITAATQANVFRMRLKEAGVTVDMGDDEGGGSKISKPLGQSKSRGAKDWKAPWHA